MQGSAPYIYLLTEINDKKACINIKNNDNAYFAWAMVSVLYPSDQLKYPGRSSSYPHYPLC